LGTTAGGASTPIIDQAHAGEGLDRHFDAQELTAEEQVVAVVPSRRGIPEVFRGGSEAVGAADGGGSVARAINVTRVKD
ncbi:MAG: hypothetical protein AAGF12_29690, partial [Myxococcota bacterium]